ECAQEGLLRDVLRVRRVAGHPVRCVVDDAHERDRGRLEPPAPHLLHSIRPRTQGPTARVAGGGGGGHGCHGRCMKSLGATVLMMKPIIEPTIAMANAIRNRLVSILRSRRSRTSRWLYLRTTKATAVARRGHSKRGLTFHPTPTG